MSLKPKRSCYAYIRFCSPLPFNRRLRPDVLHARPTRRHGGPVPSYPPYNIERHGENAFRISVAVAGFTDADLSIEAKENTLTIRGEKQTNDEEKSGDVLYKGIAERTFERSFQLADHVVVKGASLANGLLHVDLVREIPEAMKPRAIPIASSGKVLNVEPTKVAA